MEFTPGYGLVLFRANGTPTMMPTGPWGLAAGGVRFTADTATYEMLTPAGSVPGRACGTGLAIELAAARTTFDVSAAVAVAADEVTHQMAGLDPAELPDAQKPTAIRLQRMDISDEGAGAVISIRTVAVGTAAREIRFLGQGEG